MMGGILQTTAVVKKWGNSLGVIIDRNASKKLGLKEGQQVSLEIVPKGKVSAFGITKGSRGFRRDHADREF